MFGGSTKSVLESNDEAQHRQELTTSQQGNGESMTIRTEEPSPIRTPKQSTQSKVDRLPLRLPMSHAEI